MERQGESERMGKASPSSREELEERVKVAVSAVRGDLVKSRSGWRTRGRRDRGSILNSSTARSISLWRAGGGFGGAGAGRVWAQSWLGERKNRSGASDSQRSGKTRIAEPTPLSGSPTDSAEAACCFTDSAA